VCVVILVELLFDCEFVQLAALLLAHPSVECISMLVAKVER
jgi:hypothetical protein